ncbi:S4 domain-containing protein, partial [Crocosphaera sp.]
MSKLRLDLLLVERDFCSSRQQAQRCIRAGDVKVNQRIIDKPGTVVEIAADIELKAKPPYVSRGGLKLEKAIKLFKIAVEDRTCLD